nr:ParB/RepB/Spo0J family partition protein [Actinomyces wuliandei]
MAQKRRGLGRGLQALIPDTQRETVSSGRPSDVFFPENRENDVAAMDESQGGHTGNFQGSEVLVGQEKFSQLDSSGSVDSEDKSTPKGALKRLSYSDSSRDAYSEGVDVAVETGQGEPAEHDLKSETATTRQRKQSRRARSTAEKTLRGSGSGRRIDGSSGSGAAQDRGKGTSTHVSRETASKSSQQADDVHAADRRPSRSQATPIGDGGDSGDVAVHSSQTASDQHVTNSEGNYDAQVSVVKEGELVPVPGATYADIPVDRIDPNPRQPRQVFDEEEITELAASIVEVGLLQPVVVRRVSSRERQEEERFELILGERRLRAVKEASLDTIPAVVRDTDDVDMLRNALLENLHRVQLNPLEEAAAYQQLLDDFNCTQAELSERIARSRSQISNTLRLMKLPPLVQRRLAAGVLSAGHARALLGLPHVDAMERMAQRVVAEGLSVRATEELVALHEESDSSRQQTKTLRARSTPLPALSTRLSDAFDTRVKVTRGAKKGRITIEFAGDDDLARIIRTLAPGTSLDED